MRRAALLVVAALLLAGCSAPMNGGGPGDLSAGPATAENGGQADPATDRLGWENGYWYDDPIAVNATDGLNESEREAVVSRAMARVEKLRGLEFEEPVNLTVVSRSEYGGGGSAKRSEAFRQFDNAKFEALFLIGTRDDSLRTQDNTRNQTIAGSYSPQRGDIVIVSESDTPQLDGEGTLAHELTHALQDQHLELTRSAASTRDAYNARNGLIEGDAKTVEDTYTDKCDGEWTCLPGAEADEASAGEEDEPSINLGVYIVNYFPYSDGPDFVSHLKSEGGWDAVNDAFENPPSSSTAVIHPDRYGSFEPREVTIADRTGNGWERVRPSNRADSAVLGQSTMTAMFAYTLYDDYNEQAVVEPRSFLNLEGGSVNSTDPFEYGLDATDGWAGDRMQVYHRADETGYVWKIAWESPEEAAEFADQYRDLLGHWGGNRVADETWVVAEESPFADAISLRVDGDTVTIVNAPSQSALDDIHSP